MDSPDTPVPSETEAAGHPVGKEGTIDGTSGETVDVAGEDPAPGSLKDASPSPGAPGAREPLPSGEAYNGSLPPNDPDYQGPYGPHHKSPSPRDAERVGTVEGKVAWEKMVPMPPSGRKPRKIPEMDDGAVKGITEKEVEKLESFESEYRLGAGDVIELFSYNNPNLTREYMIGPDGKFAIPVLGILDVKGMTRTELKKAIEDRMRADYQDPQVTVLVREYNNNRIYVLGEVGMPGVFNFQGEPMLLGALAQAQGVTEAADMRGCTIIRGKNTLIEVDLYALLREGNRALNLRLKPEDTIYVRENEENVFYVLGEVMNPGVFPIKRRMDATRGIALAGGPTVDGAKHKTRILRRNGSEIQIFDFRDLLRGDGTGTLIDIQPRDIVFVPRKHIAKFNYVLGEVSPMLNTIILGTALGAAF